MVVSDKYNLELFRLRVGENAGWKCEICGHVGDDCNPHHIFSRENKSTRYDPVNGSWLCDCCHRAAESHRDQFIAVMVGQRGDIWWADLVAKKNIIVKFNDDFRQQWKEKLLWRVAA